MSERPDDGKGLRCPRCGGDAYRTTHRRPAPGGVTRRYHRCPCGHRFASDQVLPGRVKR